MMPTITRIETAIPAGIMPNLILVRIHTDDGLIGCGETYYTPEYLIELGEPPDDMDRWLEYAEFAKKNQNRKVSYADLRNLLVKTQGLIDTYEELLQRKVDAGSVDAFLSDAVTLLSVVQSLLDQDANLVMATHEETMIPFVSRTEM